MIANLDQQGFNLLKLLVDVLKNADPSDPNTFITYTEVHKRLNIPVLGGNPGRSLQAQGINTLAGWAAHQKLPAITGLIVREADRSPGPGYFKGNGKREIEDTGWWLDEMGRAKQTDWSFFIEPNNDATRRASIHDELDLMKEAKRIANLIFTRVSLSSSYVEHRAPERTAPDDLIRSVQHLLSADPLICYLCGGPMQIRPKNRLMQPSPDRIDSQMGDYGTANMKLAHLVCNLGKNAASVAEFQEWLTTLRECT